MAPRALQASTAPQLVPKASEVVHAVESLYQDELRPMGRILLRRLRELAAEAQATVQGRAVSDADVEAMGLIDPRYLRSLCETCSELMVLPADGKEYAVELRHVPRGVFVDPGSARDPYAGSMWAAFAEYIMDLDEASSTWPSGRYACAQMLRSRNVPCLRGLSLGELCHIVQLAISQKKILGYASGHTVQYHRSDEYIKLRCAVRQQPLELGDGDLPFASWADVCRGLVELLETSTTPMPGMLSVSNVKRLFRAQLNLELSETVLGHSKIGDLLQDPRLATICSVQGVGSGQAVVVQNYQAATQTPAQQSSYYQQWQQHATGVTLCAPVNHTGSNSQVCLSTCASNRAPVSSPTSSPISSTTPGTMAHTLFSTSPCPQPQVLGSAVVTRELTAQTAIATATATSTTTTAGTMTMGCLSSLPISLSMSVAKSAAASVALSTTTTTTAIASSATATATTAMTTLTAMGLQQQDGASTTASVAYSNEEFEEAQKVAMLAFEACGRSRQGSNYGCCPYGDTGSASTDRHDGSDSSCSSIHFQSYFYPGCQGYYYQPQQQQQQQYYSQSPPLSVCCPNSPPRSIAEVSDHAFDEVVQEVQEVEEEEEEDKKEDEDKKTESKELLLLLSEEGEQKQKQTKKHSVLEETAMPIPALSLPSPVGTSKGVLNFAILGIVEEVEKKAVVGACPVAKNDNDDDDATEDEVTTEDDEEYEADEDAAVCRALPAFENYGLVVKNGFLDEAPRRSYFRHSRSRSL